LYERRPDRPEKLPSARAFKTSVTSFGLKSLARAHAAVLKPLFAQGAILMGKTNLYELSFDTTVVETDVHHPTDNTLLFDVVRVLTRLLGRLAEALEQHRIAGFCNRSRAAHRRMYEIQR
jgi:transposase, IS5 family